MDKAYVRKKRATNQYCALLFRSRLQHFLRYGPGLALMEAWDQTWSEGLCWILAEGLFHWVTSSSEVSPESVSLMMLGDAECPVQHVVVHIKHAGQEWYLDSDGVSIKGQLLRIWREDEMLKEPFLAPYYEQLLLRYRIPRDRSKSAQIVECLTSTFGSFSPSFLDE